MPTVTEGRLDGLVEFTPDVHGDKRGSFYEAWRQDIFDRAVGRRVTFVQDNHSVSRRGVLRGLHYQLPPHAQGKLVRCTVGTVFDVAVDIRRGSPTFGEWSGHELSADNRLQLWLPPGYAHGFLALTDLSEVQYKVTDVHAPDCERSIAWDDPDLGIEWPADGSPVVSDKDADAPPLATADLFESHDLPGP